MVHKSLSVISVNDLFTDSYALVKKNWLNFVIWNLIGIGVIIGVSLILILLMALLGLGTLLPAIIGKSMNPSVLFSFGVTAIIMIIVSIIVLTIISLILQIGMIRLILGDFKDKSYVQLFKSSWSFVPSLIVVGLITFVLVFGGLALLIIPGLVLSFLFMFVNYEVLAHRISGIQALKNSTRIIYDNFWEILGRMLLLLIVAIVFFSIFAIILSSSKSNSTLFAILSIARGVIQILFSWFAMVYSILLYQSARKRSDLQNTPNLLWTYIISALGWILVAGSVILIVRFITTGGLKQIQQAMREDFQQKHMQQMPNQNSLKQLQESRTLLMQMNEIYQTDNTPTKTIKIQQLNDKNITGLRSALTTDPDNVLLWSTLCISYELPNTVGIEKERLEACSKAPLPTFAPDQNTDIQ